MFGTQKWYNTLQFTAMMIFALAIPLDWKSGQVSLWAAVWLAVCSGVKLFAERRTGWRNLRPAARWGLALMVAYWLFHVAYAPFSSDRSEAWSLVWLKASWIIVPLCLLLTDCSYLTRRHLRGVLWALVAGVLLRVGWMSGRAVVRLCSGESPAQVANVQFDLRHHAYAALYATAAIAVIYSELFTHARQWPAWRKACCAVAIALLMFYIFLVNSRAGNLVIYAVGLVAVCHLAFAMRRWWQALVLGVVLVAFTLGAPQVIPGHSDRLAWTLSQLASGNDSDARIAISRSATAVSLQSPLTGQGTGDYRASLVDDYKARGNHHSQRENHNAHNQYLETFMALGLLGLLPFLAMLVLPLCASLRQRRQFLIGMLIFTVIFNLLFESMLERQMGLQFISLIYGTMLLIINLEQNKFCQSEKH